jgi:hypothetical protein
MLPNGLQVRWPAGYPESMNANLMPLPAALPTLTEREARFAEHFAVFDCPADAYLTSGEVAPTTKRSSVLRAAYALLARPHVRARITTLRNAIAAAGPKATQAALVADLQDALAVDVAEIVRLEVVHCPSCYSSPAYHAQWPMLAAAALDAGSSELPPEPLTSDQFDPTRDPWHSCALCLGAGRKVVRMTSTAQLSAPARRLIRGYETHADGSVKKVLLTDTAQLRQELHRTIPGFYAPDRSVTVNLNADIKPLRHDMTLDEVVAAWESISPTEALPVPEDTVVSEQ